VSAAAGRARRRAKRPLPPVTVTEAAAPCSCPPPQPQAEGRERREQGEGEGPRVASLPNLPAVGASVCGTGLRVRTPDHLCGCSRPDDVQAAADDALELELGAIRGRNPSAIRRPGGGGPRETSGSVARSAAEVEKGDRLSEGDEWRRSCRSAEIGVTPWSRGGIFVVVRELPSERSSLSPSTTTASDPSGPELCVT
jgi:hypothetical protein